MSMISRGAAQRNRPVPRRPQAKLSFACHHLPSGAFHVCFTNRLRRIPPTAFSKLNPVNKFNDSALIYWPTILEIGEAIESFQLPQNPHAKSVRSGRLRGF